MAHFLTARDISVLKAYWVNHAVDQNAEYGVQSNKRQTCVGVYGIDIHPDGSRFATCGADEKIKIWSMAPIISVDVEVSECVDKLLCCCKYDKSLNKNCNYSFNNTIHCVRWSHNGDYLGSAAADGIVTIWRLSTNTNHSNSHNTDSTNIEHWIIAQQLTKHRDLANSSNSSLTSDVQEIVWAPNDLHLISAGSDHNIIIWRKTPNRNNNIFECMKVIDTAHHDIICGLCIDPLNEYLVSQSADGSAKIWNINRDYELKHQLKDEFKSRSHFIRANTNDDLTRLDVGQKGSFSPDGAHLLCSFGVSNDNIFISPMYHRSNFENEYAFVGHYKPTTVSKWNPRIYKSSDNDEMFFVAAIGSMDRTLSVWSTLQKTPLIVFNDISKAAILDITWSRSGDILMASTHDGNVMAFVFGENAFGGHRLSVTQHMQYVSHVYNGRLEPNIMNNMKHNITLIQSTRFNRMKHENKEEFIPSDDVFGAKETQGMSFNINYEQKIEFDAVESKREQNNIETIHSNSNSTSNGYCTPVDRDAQENVNINECSVRRRKKEKKEKLKPKSSKKRKRKEESDGNGNERSKRKKRKYNYEIYLNSTNSEFIEKRIRLNDSEYVRIESQLIKRANQDENDNVESVSLLSAFLVTNGTERMQWKTEISTQITAIALNTQSIFCGTIYGELYWFNVDGIMVIPPIQMAEEIALLDIKDEYLMIITVECTLRVWKISGNNLNEIENTNFSCLMKMSKKRLQNNSNYNKKDSIHISLKNAFITKNARIMLTLSDGYRFTFESSLKCWIRICDDKYWASHKRKSNANNANNNDDKIGNDAFTFSQLMDSMNNCSKSVSVMHMENAQYSEVCCMHTISHLEQQLSAFRLFKDKESEFERVLMDYIEQLISSLSLNSLRFGTNKLNAIFRSLLNWNCHYPGSPSFQSKVLRKLIQSVNHRNGDPSKEYYVQLQQLTFKYSRALDACMTRDSL